MLANITNWAIGIWFVVLDGDLDLHYVPNQEQDLTQTKFLDVLGIIHVFKADGPNFINHGDKGNAEVLRTV